MRALLTALALILSGCSPKVDYFKIASVEYNVDYHILRSIAEVESNNHPFTVNVNESIFDFQRGSHKFDNWFTANLYMDMILDPLGLSYDIGLCQINNANADKYGLDNEDLLDEETNINIASKILRWNLKYCRGNYKCALSMYNTGQKNSKRGRYYTRKVYNARKELFGY